LKAAKGKKPSDEVDDRKGLLSLSAVTLKAAKGKRPSDEVDD
jgi:hypothetical protein